VIRTMKEERVSDERQVMIAEERPYSWRQIERVIAARTWGLRQKNRRRLGMTGMVREPRLWSRRPWRGALIKVGALVFVVFILTILSLHFKVSRLPRAWILLWLLSYAVVLVAGSLAIVLLVKWGLRRRAVVGKPIQTWQAFETACQKLQDLPSGFIKSARESIASAYGISPEMVCADDSYASLGGLSILDPPFAHEILADTLSRLGRIGEYESAAQSLSGYPCDTSESVGEIITRLYLICYPKKVESADEKK